MLGRKQQPLRASFLTGYMLNSTSWQQLRMVVQSPNRSYWPRRYTNQWFSDHSPKTSNLSLAPELNPRPTLSKCAEAWGGGVPAFQMTLILSKVCTPPQQPRPCCSCLSHPSRRSFQGWLLNQVSNDICLIFAHKIDLFWLCSFTLLVTVNIEWLII